MPNDEIDGKEATETTKEEIAGTSASNFKLITTKPLMAISSAQEAALRHDDTNCEIQGGQANHAEV